jgi:hypothetical protein
VDFVDAFANWAWERHHNPWSWYIRPLFLIPFCWFAWKRSILGMTLTVLALATSMFWFPKPQEVDPAIQAFLRMERDYLLGQWAWWKILLTLSVPVWFAVLATAFWRQSLFWGAVAINIAAIGKIAWSFHFGGDAAWALVPPALAGLLICNIAVYLLYRYRRRVASSEPQG